MKKLRPLLILSAIVALFSLAQIRNLCGSRHTLSEYIEVCVFILLGIAGAGTPLCVLVMLADKRRQEVETLNRLRYDGRLTQGEFEEQKLRILNRSYWQS